MDGQCVPILTSQKLYPFDIIFAEKTKFLMVTFEVLGLWLCHLTLKSVPTLYSIAQVWGYPQFKSRDISSQDAKIFDCIKKGNSVFFPFDLWVEISIHFYKLWIDLLQAIKNIISLVKLSDEWINTGFT